MAPGLGGGIPKDPLQPSLRHFMAPQAPNSLSPLPLLLGPQSDWWGKRGDSHPHEGLGASGGGTRRRKGLCTEAEVLDREQRVALRLTAKAPET